MTCQNRTSERGALLIESIAAIAIGGLLTLGTLQALFLYQQRVREDAAAAYMDKTHEAALAYAASSHFADSRQALRENAASLPIVVPVSELREKGLLPSSFPARSPYGPMPDIIYTGTQEGIVPYLNIAVRMGGISQGPAGRILLAVKAPYKGFFDSAESLRWQNGTNFGVQEIENLFGRGNSAANQILAFASLPLTSAIAAPGPRRTITIKMNQSALRRALSHQTKQIGETWEAYVNSPIEGSYNFFADARNNINNLRTVKRDSTRPDPSISRSDPMAPYFTPDNGLVLSHLKAQFARRVSKKTPSEIEQANGVAVAPFVLQNDLYYFQPEFNPGYRFSLGAPRRVTTSGDFTYTALDTGRFDYDNSYRYYKGIKPHDPFAPDGEPNLAEAYVFSPGPGPPGITDTEDTSFLGYYEGGQAHFNLYRVIEPDTYSWDLRYDPPGDLHTATQLRYFPLIGYTKYEQFFYNTNLYDEDAPDWAKYVRDQPSVASSPKYLSFAIPVAFDGVSVTLRAEDNTWGPSWGRNEVNRLVKTPRGSGYDIPAHVCPKNYIASASWQPIGVQWQPKYDVPPSNLPINNTWYLTHVLSTSAIYSASTHGRYLFTADGGHLRHLYRYCRFNRAPETNFLRGPAYMLTPPSNADKKDDYILTGNTDAQPGDCLKRASVPTYDPWKDKVVYPTECLAWLESDETE